MASDDRPADELEELLDVIQHQSERISQLEQVLDQTIVIVNELRSQLVHQDWLEAQLAATEEIANVQQQAIHHLKLKMTAEQPLETSRASALPGLLLADGEQAWEQLTEQEGAFGEGAEHAQDLDDLSNSASSQTPATRLEVRFTQAQQQIQILYQRLRGDSNDRLKASQESVDPSKLAHDLPLEGQIGQLQQRLQELESESSKQMQVQAFLQQACQELEREREEHQLRILELEHQTAEMQEQIVRQAQQASEYETAIQHWKDRFYHIQNQTLSLKELLEQMSEPLPDQIMTLLSTIPQPTTSEQMQSLRRAVPRRSDLPEFLQRRRGYRKR
ncbi:hypothetical protein [Alkalinema sp. FACHB-956]|uniref:hypothetical protein n=1 Tax=Alkalinema sp. FACHB-956 TaxID=2692768 RepID=UPI001686B3ED|nr:hypothetical protein [Alkalinema sp. FACHB-956]MBD2329381.1 hypothetical protein [Alkalinema sp. FACHB-956]